MTSRKDRFYASPDRARQEIRRPCKEHSFLTDIDDVRQMEESLLQLLEDFNSGKLLAGNDCPFEKLDAVREQQEQLMRIHFAMDVDLHTEHPKLVRGRGQGGNGSRSLPTEEGRQKTQKNLNCLIEKLESLSYSIQNLHKNQSTGK